MNLTIFNAETAPKNSYSQKSSLPKITFSKNGSIMLNKAAITLLDTNVGEKVSICQDEDTPENWYVYKDENGFELRGKDLEKTGYLCFNHSGLKNIFLESLGVDKDTTCGFLIGGEATEFNGIKYYGILING
jgi:hypothetical protein